MPRYDDKILRLFEVHASEIAELKVDACPDWGEDEAAFAACLAVLHDELTLDAPTTSWVEQADEGLDTPFYDAFFGGDDEIFAQRCALLRSFASVLLPELTPTRRGVQLLDILRTYARIDETTNIPIDAVTVALEALEAHPEMPTAKEAAELVARVVPNVLQHFPLARVMNVLQGYRGKTCKTALETLHALPDASEMQFISHTEPVGTELDAVAGALGMQPTGDGGFRGSNTGAGGVDRLRSLRGDAANLLSGRVTASKLFDRWPLREAFAHAEWGGPARVVRRRGHWVCLEVEAVHTPYTEPWNPKLGFMMVLWKDGDRIHGAVVQDATHLCEVLGIHETEANDTETGMFVEDYRPEL